MRKKKITDEQIAESIGKLAEQVKSEMDFDLRVAHGQMWLAEHDLVDTFTEEQLKLYKDFCEKRDIFFDIASELYERKI